ncbi:hypothetical protein TNCV_1782221 [Trichonephila clavipes]|nr:hypothetical protein TNCV_1782221 [Trichonephila clavipes]
MSQREFWGPSTKELGPGCHGMSFIPYLLADRIESQRWDTLASPSKHSIPMGLLVLLSGSVHFGVEEGASDRNMFAFFSLGEDVDV